VAITTHGGEAVVPDAAARRLSNQVARVRNGTYGAGIGLRTLMRLASVQMLRAGASHEAVVRALADLVLNCPGAASAPPNEADRLDRASAMRALTAEYISDVADQPADARSTTRSTRRFTAG